MRNPSTNRDARIKLDAKSDGFPPAFAGVNPSYSRCKVSRSATHPLEAALGQPDEEGGAVGRGGVVEIIAGVVDFAATLAVAVADLDVGAGNPLEHVGEILRRHD